MSNTRDNRPEAESFNAAAVEAKDAIADSAKYVKDRVTAPASGDRSADLDVKDKAHETAHDAKQQGKGIIGTITDGAKYIGSRFTASPAGEDGDNGQKKAEESENEASNWLSSTSNKAQEKYDEAGNKIEEKKQEAQQKYDETQKNIADKTSTTSAEEAKARGEIPSYGRHTDQEAKDEAALAARETKEQGKGLADSVFESAHYIGSRFTANPSGDKEDAAKPHAQSTKEEGSNFLSSVGSKAQETYNKAGDRLEETKEDAKQKYDDTQQSIADKLATNSIEEARVAGEIPTNSESVKAHTS